MRLILLLVAAALTLSAADDARLTPEERAKAVKYLLDSQQETLEAAAGLSDAQWSFKPAPDKWSVGETVEHIWLAEGLLFDAVEKALAAKPNPEWEAKTKGKTEFLERTLTSRARRAQAPEQIVPEGKLGRAEIIRRYQEARARTLKFAEQTDLPLKAHTLDHPFPVFNTLNAYQWMIYIPLHNLRHNQQIAEIKASPDFPKQ